MKIWLTHKFIFFSGIFNPVLFIPVHFLIDLTHKNNTSQALRREFDNQFNKFAVKLLNSEEIVSYLPREYEIPGVTKSPVVLSLCDAG